MKNTNYYAVLMAGGVGSRFWPVSTQRFPKQFHDMLGTGQSLLQKTFSRLARFIPEEHILILTNARYSDQVLEQLPGVSKEQIIGEPAMRNTAPCILYAALKIRKMNPEALMLVAPSDHWIEDEAAFERDVEACFAQCADYRTLCTLGIQPTFPNTGFGYIEYDAGETVGSGLRTVRQFREKPDYQTARQFLSQGNFLWNAGIFAWSAAGIVSAFEQYQPGMYGMFLKGLDTYNTEAESAFIDQHYPTAENVSIDYAIMERSDAVKVLPASFDWNDLGTWGSLYDKMDKDEGQNAIAQGNVLLKDSSGNMVRLPEGKVAVLEGMRDFIVIDKPDVLMIIPREREQEIKQWVAEVRRTCGDEYI
ncbi:mannose-1-phosphate guanylyltransferase [Robiginitalea sp. SC105]|uniref:mannose-1-phosphate guanylyltransferase n=1 Tax=Robiginitalea sp. SC105 TaxID=2762332 RepID=UPI001639C35D|nr:mannose-1-phosphate guanylyltransferase [Robiginitalea sp. SC105]MBC2839581.1 mannose-1-phosphate guanylyltransferase [Robiginitalea sp. SC105]